jgi:hypothetical protein
VQAQGRGKEWRLSAARDECRPAFTADSGHNNAGQSQLNTALNYRVTIIVKMIEIKMTVTVDQRHHSYNPE